MKKVLFSLVVVLMLVSISSCSTPTPTPPPVEPPQVGAPVDNPPAGSGKDQPNVGDMPNRDVIMCMFENPIWPETVVYEFMVAGLKFQLAGLPMYQVRPGLAVMDLGKAGLLVLSKDGVIPADIGVVHETLNLPHAAYPGMSAVMLKWTRITATEKFSNEVRDFEKKFK